MRAMTWWDHETDSVWSQPWGMAIDGPLQGTRLELIPASIIPWASWLEEHPDTLVLEPGDSPFSRITRAPIFNFVIGVILGDDAKAYPFPAVSELGLVNDRVGPFPVVVVAEAETRAVYAYLRKFDEREFKFTLEGDRLRDSETGTFWDVASGVGVEGPLRGEVLQKVPWITSFDWAWKDFYPDSEYFGEPT